MKKIANILNKLLLTVYGLSNLFIIISTSNDLYSRHNKFEVEKSQFVQYQESRKIHISFCNSNYKSKPSGFMRVSPDYVKCYERYPEKSEPTYWQEWLKNNLKMVLLYLIISPFVCFFIMKWVSWIFA